MSTLKVNTIQDTTGNDALTIDSSGNVTASQGFVPSTQLSHRNLVINGAMQVAQRGTATSNGYTLDRWAFNSTGMDDFAFSITQNTSSGLSEFPNSLKFTTTTAESAVDANDRAYFDYRIEGQNLQNLGYGTSDAKTMTLSFWVKSSVTGTYASFIYQDDASPARSYLANWTIDTANTWEKKTITIAGDSGGNINNDNGPAFYLRWFLFAGSDWSGSSTPLHTWGSTVGRTEAPNQTAQVPLTNNSTWELTGVQLEVGSVATPFEHRSYGEELARCQRYYYKPGGDIETWRNWANSHGIGYIWFPVQMRIAPSVSNTANSYNVTSKTTHVFGYASTLTSGQAFGITADAEL